MSEPGAACPVGGERPLTSGERALVTEVFGTSIDTNTVRLRRRRWFPLQPTNVVMAPMGHLHFAPASPHWCDDFSCASLGGQGLFIHEMVHVWQTQHRGKWWLPLMRHPFCRYSYTYREGRPFERYGIEQQAELVRHLFMARRGNPHPDAPPLATLEALVPFTNT